MVKKTIKTNLKKHNIILIKENRYNDKYKNLKMNIITKRLVQSYRNQAT